MANYQAANWKTNKQVPAWPLTPTRKTRLTLCCGNCRAADEPGWEIPWGRGRPGWHIECSVMSKQHLGEVFDIHGGGLDLIFPHHENEIAQSRCAHGSQVMANYWMHNGFLQVEGQKMSKSLGNFVTISQCSLNDLGVAECCAFEYVARRIIGSRLIGPIDSLEETRANFQSWHDVDRWRSSQKPESDLW